MNFINNNFDYELPEIILMNFRYWSEHVINIKRVLVDFRYAFVL